MQHRMATSADVPLLAAMNRELAEDEKHRNAAREPAWFESRMGGWLAGEWRAVVFFEGTSPVGYALWCDRDDEIYLRQFFIRRDRRRRGLGRQAMKLLRDFWPDRRLTVEALLVNQPAISFWRAMGFRDYSVTLEIPAGGGSEHAG